jgi:hypothetical protein
MKMKKMKKAAQAVELYKASGQAMTTKDLFQIAETSIVVKRVLKAEPAIATQRNDE